MPNVTSKPATVFKRAIRASLELMVDTSVRDAAIQVHNAAVEGAAQLLATNPHKLIDRDKAIENIRALKMPL